MRLTVWLFGHELFTVSIDSPSPEPDDERGDCTTTPFGFVPSPGDQRYESCPEFE